MINTLVVAIPKLDHHLALLGLVLLSPVNL